MSAYSVSGFVGALLAVFIIRRVARWLLQFALGDGVALIVVSLLLTLVVTTVTGAYGFGENGSPRFDRVLPTYLPAVIVWLLLDLLALRGRRARTWEKQKGIADVFAGEARDTANTGATD